MDGIVEFAFKNNAIDYDAYCVLKRFYIRDPKYANYITTRIDAMKAELGYF